MSLIGGGAVELASLKGKGEKPRKPFKESLDTWPPALVIASWLGLSTSRASLMGLKDLAFRGSATALASLISAS